MKKTQILEKYLLRSQYFGIFLEKLLICNFFSLSFNYKQDDDKGRLKKAAKKKVDNTSTQHFDPKVNKHHIEPSHSPNAMF